MDGWMACVCVCVRVRVCVCVCVLEIDRKSSCTRRCCLVAADA
jgi:hypothetical protein